MLLDVSQFTSHTTENLCELYLWFKEQTLSYQDKRVFFTAGQRWGLNY